MPRPKRTQSERDAATTALVQATRDKPRPTIEQLREAVEKADQEGVTTLRFEFARSASSKAKTWLLAGPGSPRCLLEPPPHRVAGYNFAATWAVSDIRLWLRGLEHRCHALGCGEPTDPRYLLCPKHWKVLGGKLRVDVLAAYGRGPCRVDTEASVMATRSWIVAATRAVCDVAVKEGNLTPEQGRALVAHAKELPLGPRPDEPRHPYAALLHAMGEIQEWPALASRVLGHDDHDRSE